MSCQDSSYSFDSSGGVFPDGYCVWEERNGVYYPISCHCRDGFCCGSGPGGMKRSKFAGQRVRWPCELGTSGAQQQQQQQQF